MKKYELIEENKIKNEIISIKISKEDKKKFEIVCKKKNLSLANGLRQLIKACISDEL